MILHLSDHAAVGLSVVVWLFIGLGSGFYFSRVPLGRLDQDNVITRERPFEAHGAFYQRHLRIGNWKDRLPEAGNFFPDGFSKRHLTSRSEQHLNRFAAETRRAELVHWTNLCAGPAFLLWCRPMVGGLMVVFGVVTHLPFIAIQRFNRQRLQRVLARSASPRRRAHL
ncbi:MULTISPECIES: hypothetical protein [Candidatus Neomicrothrix]|uniref:Glycosyl-4,4'-diaponeurosporenoate acyltransferase n=1 Tax=Candidatus Neomicrothrix parvicella RN1 TaxID=1229780 RepID=R4Z0V2_9ACTN|nr:MULTISPECIES: hypothetical protein [Microthrix]NLH65882.1 hypothetical protein [Candidatus Microthrix parvicella]MBK7322227.1 hypothetical protein [Candidatus Microthrix sp.]MBP7878466.1 hypothetical protein [Candidatus Microthrix sp.]MBP8957917.1 hypothetical protein [Candidatus Microthrix sp.]MBP9622241.1 hypothetical protein [Candidatus Microthrix sp.]